MPSSTISEVIILAKECRVILRNQLVMVVLYGDKKIQMPTDNTNKPTVYVKKEYGRYFLVDKLEEEKPKYEKPKKKKAIETDLVDEVVETDIEISE